MASATLEFLRTGHDSEAVQPTDVNALLESLQADCEETGAAVAIEGRANAPFPARPIALKRALANLVDNAISYAGGTTIRVEDTPAELCIVVADEGPGIPDDRLHEVFEPFYRLEPSRSRRTGGADLGLSIARDILQSHGGNLTLRNRAHAGLEGPVTLPRHRR